MRACEGCRRRKIKCDAATTNTWPCSACIRLKLHCVRPNGYDGAADTQVYEPADYEPAEVPDAFRQQMSMQQQQQQQQQQQMLAGPSKQNPSMYTQQGSYTDTTGLYQPVQFSNPQGSNQALHYTTIPPPVGVVDPSYTPQNVFPTPPLQQGSRHDSPPAIYSQDQYGQQDLSDLLGSLKMNEAGTGEPPSSELTRRWYLISAKHPT